MKHKPYLYASLEENNMKKSLWARGLQTSLVIAISNKHFKHLFKIDPWVNYMLHSFCPDEISYLSILLCIIKVFHP